MCALVRFLVPSSVRRLPEVVSLKFGLGEEKLHQTIAWVKEHGSEIADKSFISNNTSVIKKGKKKDRTPIGNSLVS